jgi:hypothetical protein
MIMHTHQQAVQLRGRPLIRITDFSYQYTSHQKIKHSPSSSPPPLSSLENQPPSTPGISLNNPSTTINTIRIQIIAQIISSLPANILLPPPASLTISVLINSNATLCKPVFWTPGNGRGKAFAVAVEVLVGDIGVAVEAAGVEAFGFVVDFPSEGGV